ncbi:MAG: glycosyltransferase family 4 protein [Methanophagales archaeon]|nr:glycosyltransferase family 4 protein [Methanophagales archaeon]
MKILITQDTDWIKRYPGQQHHLADRFSLKGHEIRVIDYEILWRKEGKRELYSKRQVFNNVSKVIKNANITVIRPALLKIPMLEYISMLFTYSREINRQIREFKPDILIAHTILSDYLAIRASKKNNIPIVLHLTDVEYCAVSPKLLQPLAKIIESKNLKNADKVVTINEKLKDFAIKMGSNPEETYVVRAGIDLERYDPNIDDSEIRKEYGIKEDDIVLFFMGWLYHFSGLKEVTVELSRIKKRKPMIKFLIVGAGDAFNDLQRIIEEHHLDNQVILTGKQPYERIPAFIASSDICLLPAYNNEIMRNIVPIKMYEYMAVGKPVIATKLPGIVKEFGDDHGVIYVDRPEEVVEKAIELVTNGASKELGSKARGFVKGLSWDNITDEFERIIEEVRSGK